MREPNDGWIFGCVFFVDGFYGSVTVESTIFYEEDFAAWKPVTLVVGDIEFAEGTEANSVRSSKSGGNEPIFTSFGVNFKCSAPVDDLGLRGFTTGVNRSCEVAIELAVHVFKAKCEFVKIRGDSPAVGDATILIGNSIFVVVNEFGEFLLLQDVGSSVNDFETKWFSKSTGYSFDGHLRWGFVPIVNLVNGSVGIPSTDEHVIVWEESDAANSGMEFVWPCLGKGVRRMNCLERSTVSSSEVVDSHDAFFARCSNANFSRWGCES